MRTEVIGNATLYLADCREVLPTLAQVDAIITDPPYYGVLDDAWDNAWKDEQQFLDWMSGNAEQWMRVLKFNGSLYCFCWPAMSARLEITLAKHFKILNSIVWHKCRRVMSAKTRKEALRAYAPGGERIVFAEHYRSDNIAKGETDYYLACDALRGDIFKPLREYLSSEWLRAGLKYGDANAACGTVSMAARHYFTRSQWALPTPEHYAALQRYANRGLARDEYLRREYEDLRREYEDLRRPFFVDAQSAYTDIWEFNPIAAGSGAHPAQKPLDLMLHMIKTSTKPGCVCLDPFMGSGTTGVAALQLGRKFIGIELEPEYFDVACRRLERALADRSLLDAQPAPRPQQLGLLEI